MMKEKRSLMKKETFFLHSQIIKQKVQKHPSYIHAQTVGFYVSLPGEVDTISFIQEALKTHRVCVPKVIGDEMEFYYIHSLDDLQVGTFHVLEPTTHEKVFPQDIDVIIVPMLAFDCHFHRVGYGKGYYDKYFAKEFQGYKLGIAFSFQKVDKIDINPYDLPLDDIICE